MIKSQNHNYRIGSEPLNAIVTSLNLEIQFEYVEKICIFDQLEQLVKMSEKNEKFCKYFINSLQSLHSIKPLYNVIEEAANTGNINQ